MCIKNWWEIISDSDQSIANAFGSCKFPEDAFELKWPQNHIDVFCQNFIKRYENKDDSAKENARIYMSDLIKKEWGKGNIEFTPFICMMYIDAYFDNRPIEEVLAFFVEYLVKSGKKKTREDASLFLEKHKKYFRDLNQKGKSRLIIPEMGSKKENTSYDGIEEMHREL